MRYDEYRIGGLPYTRGGGYALWCGHMESVDPKVLTRMTQAAISESLALVAMARTNLVQTTALIAKLRDECIEIRRHLRSPQFKSVLIGADRSPDTL